MREGGGAEATFQREHDELATQMAALQVDQARLEDRRALLRTNSPNCAAGTCRPAGSRPPMSPERPPSRSSGLWTGPSNVGSASVR